jgi:hypothetical protein
MAKITATLPVSGEVTKVFVTKENKTVTEGANEFMGIQELNALVGSEPVGMLSITVMDEDPDNSACTVEIETDDSTWLALVENYLTGKTPTQLQEATHFVHPVTDAFGETGALEVQDSKVSESKRSKPVVRTDLV